MSNFTATHQALLFAWISRAVVDEVGFKEGERIMRKAVKIYAMQRGRRMAQRAKLNGDELTMNTYFAYVEYKPAKGDFKKKLVQRAPNARVNVFKCPYYNVWKENGLMPYGRFFCLEVDKAVVKGFNKNLNVDVLGTTPNGAEYCDLIFEGGNLTLKNILKMVYKKFKLRKTVIMPFEYHVGHTYKTIKEVIYDELGSRSKTEAIMERALQDFTKKYGHESTEIVRKYENTDFNNILEREISSIG
ncbi:L-2-amino-thiazoline-4-carboxylic acid hydrolase [Clostridiaceae bacterium M8S5]|nr:L-2-amino-thiazoline-4-carboxylic acid hydrolase [Clostridiaceae bacterium M8S5]